MAVPRDPELAALLVKQQQKYIRNKYQFPGVNRGHEEPSPSKTDFKK